MHNTSVRRHFAAVTATMMLFISADSGATLNASGNGQWISIGSPGDVYLGTNGDFYLSGSDKGSCQSVQPGYFRFDTNQPKWKEMYALLLYAAANQRCVDCTVDSGCGHHLGLGELLPDRVVDHATRARSLRWTLRTY